MTPVSKRRDFVSFLSFLVLGFGVLVSYGAPWSLAYFPGVYFVVALRLPRN